MRLMIPAALFVLLAANPAVPKEVNHFGYPVDTGVSTAGCVSCHNGKRGRDVSRCSTGRMCRIYGRHLVDVPYPPPGREAEYAPVEELHVYGMDLANNRITCATCHSLTSPKKHLLILEAEGDRICRACHHM